jgi:hypothetical protein
LLVYKPSNWWTKWGNLRLLMTLSLCYYLKLFPVTTYKTLRVCKVKRVYFNVSNLIGYRANRPVPFIATWIFIICICTCYWFWLTKTNTANVQSKIIFLIFLNFNELILTQIYKWTQSNCFRILSNCIIINTYDNLSLPLLVFYLKTQ